MHLVFLIVLDFPITSKLYKVLRIALQRKTFDHEDTVTLWCAHIVICAYKGFTVSSCSKVLHYIIFEWSFMQKKTLFNPFCALVSFYTPWKRRKIDDWNGLSLDWSNGYFVKWIVANVQFQLSEFNPSRPVHFWKM